MADNENSLDFTIRTRAELAGAEATATALEMQIGKAKALGQDYSELSAQLNRVQGAITNVQPELKKQNEHLEGSRLLFTEINRILPGLGHELHAAFLGPVGAVIAFASVVDAAKSQLEAFNKALDDAAESDAAHNFAEGIRAMNDALAEGIKKIADYNEAIAKVATHETTIARALGSQLGLMKAIAAERDKEANAAEAAHKAEIERQEKGGEITPEQKAIQEAQLEIKAAQDEAANKRKDEDDEIKRRQDAVDLGTASQPGLDADATAKAQKYYQEKAHRERLEKDFGPAHDKEIDDARRNLDKATDAVDKNEVIRRFRSLEKEWGDNPSDPQNKATLEGARSDLYTPDLITGETANDLILKQEQAKAQFQNLTQGQKQYNATQTPEAQAAFEKAKKDADEADRKGRENAKTVEEEKPKVEEARTQQHNTRPIEDQELADKIAKILSDAVTKLYSTTGGGELQSGVHVAEFVGKGKQITDAQAQFLMLIDKIIGGHAQTLKQAADDLVKYKDDTTGFIEAVGKIIADVRDKVALLQAQINAGT